MDIQAHITGTVWKLVAKVGENIEEDDDILIIESMKMELPLTSPMRGTLESILVEEGEFVEEGQVVARLTV